MRETDADRYRRERDELSRIVQAIFDDPGSVTPEVPNRARRNQVRLWAKPSFQDPEYWAVWGPQTTVPPDPESGLARRIIWRRGIDLAPRSHPVERMKFLGEPLRPTIEVDDAAVRLDEVAAWVARLPALESLGPLLQSGRGIQVDGTWYGVEVDSGRSRSRYEWWGDEWAPPDWTYDAIASWANEFRGWLNARIESDS